MNMNAVARRLASPMMVIAFALAASAAHAQQTPMSISGVKVVTAEDVDKLMRKGVPVIDARVANEYAEEHVKGARNVPYKEKSEKAVDFDSKRDTFDLSKLPADKKAPLVFYCNAGECWKSYKAVIVAQRDGYTDLYWFRGGFPEWKSKKLPTE
jgi:rhodanese-related sulfurtransferase